MFLRYIIKRSLAAIPTVLILALIIFLLKASIPDDIIERHFHESNLSRGGVEKDADLLAREIRSDLNLDIPLFYLSFQSAIIPDSIPIMYPIENAQFYKKLLIKYGCKVQVANYYISLLKIKKTNDEELIAFYNNLFNVLDEKRIREILYSASANRQMKTVISAFDQVVLNQNPSMALIPAIRWHGRDNQFHNWLWGILHLDFGHSIVDNLSVSGKIGTALVNTLLITIPALIGIFIICIPLGVWLSGNTSKKASMINTILYGFDAVPLFWLSLILIILFAGNNFLNIFPAFGFTFSTGNNENAIHRIVGLILPVSALILTSLAYVSNQISKSIDDQKKQLYVLAAKARGLSSKSVLWVHIFKNSLITVITVFSDYLTAIFAGSFVLEVVFSVPGMGKLLYDSVTLKDFPVILAILLLTATIKIFSHLLADIGYKIVNPAINY